MAIEFDLDINTDRTPKEVVATFLAVMGSDVPVRESEYQEGTFVAGTPAFWLSAWYPDYHFSSRILGFNPRVRMTFRLSYIDDSEVVMFQTVANWLKQSEEDAALIYNGDSVTLVRIKGQLILTSNEDAWTDETLGMFDMPYIRQKFDLL